MKFDDDDRLIKKSLNTIHTPKYDIKSNVQRKIKKQESYINFKRAIPVTIVTFMMFTFFVGVAAAYIPSFNNLLSIVSPEIAVKLQQIEESSEDDGIKMEVVAAMSDQEMAVIYVTMQDLIGNRIDETIDLYDSYSLTGGHMFNSEMVDYDEATKTATFRIQANGGKNVDGKKMNFRIGAFLSDKQEIEETIIDVNLLEVKNREVQTIELDMEQSSGGGGDVYKEELVEQGKIKILNPNEMNIGIPEINTMSITNIGIIGNNLHVQTKWSDSNIDDHGYFYLMDEAGHKIYSDTSVSFGVNASDEIEFGHNMREDIFDISTVDVETLKLAGDFVTNGKYTTGDWKTTFKLQSVEEKTLNINQEFDTWTANQLTISALGVTLSGDSKEEAVDLDLSLVMKDGSKKRFDKMRSFFENGKMKMKFISDLPLELSEVHAVIIDETEIRIEH